MVTVANRQASGVTIEFGIYNYFPPFLPAVNRIIEIKKISSVSLLHEGKLMTKF